MSTVTNEVVNMESSETNGKNANLEETDLGSAASSNNTSGEDEEAEEDEDEDEEIQFKQRRSSRTTRSSTVKNKRIKTKTKIDNKANSRRIRRGSPLNKKVPRNGSSNSQKSSISTCQLCHEALSNEELNRHLSLTHFKSKLAKLLPSEKPYKCPKCSSIEENHDNLIAHYGGQHHLNDRYLEQEGQSTVQKVNGNPPSVNTPRRSARGGTRTSSTEDESQHAPDHDLKNSDSGNDSEEDVTKPPSAWLISKPQNFQEYKQQVHTHLRLLDGRHAEVADDRSIKCVCGKTMRVNFKWNWRFLIQRPTLRNGVAQPKGHWFMCSEVARIGSIVEDWKFSKAELEASKIKDKGCDVSESIQKVSSPVRTTGRKRTLVSMEELNEDEICKNSRLDLDEDMDEDDSEEESDEEETDREKRLIIRKRVNDLLSKRIPGETFLQDGPCFTMFHEGSSMCHECKWMPLSDKRNVLTLEHWDNSEISCCFYSFRKLKVGKNGTSLSVAGYLDPVKDPDPEKPDLDIWTKSLSLPTFTSVQKAQFILQLIGDQFCDMVLAEQKCLSMHLEVAENKTIVWKPAVKGVREMCDVCKTTLFNHHWICGRCGLFVCLDCYRFRKSGQIKEENQLEANSLKDEYNWPFCNTGESHQIRKLLMAQIIPKNILVELAHKVHQLRSDLQLNQFCHQKENFDEAYSSKSIMVSIYP